MNFIAFRKAFDSVHRETLWNILKSYGIPDKIITLSNYAKQTGLNINTTKTQVMCINTTNPTPVTINGMPLDFADDFTYLFIFGPEIN